MSYFIEGSWILIMKYIVFVAKYVNIYNKQHKKDYSVQVMLPDEERLQLFKAL